MLVKICGITRLEDAEAAVALGAGALGFVFWPKSPRFVDPDRARAIVARAAAVRRDGRRVREPAGRDIVNGVAALRRAERRAAARRRDSRRCSPSIDRPVIKAVALGRSTRAEDAEAWPRASDAAARRARSRAARRHRPDGRLGRGRARSPAPAPVLLAGGLHADNVADAIARVRPFGIDVSSGVESSPGVKDHARLRALVRRRQPRHCGRAMTMRNPPRS